MERIAADPRRNIELKARLGDLEAARRVAARVATSRLGTQHQVDTYFHAPHGRLKLRQIDGLSAMLVAYRRPDQRDAKTSEYQLVPLSNPETLKQALGATLGIRVVVEKQREIFLRNNVRMHLDTVKGLGNFLEFEAVLAPGVDEVAAHSQLRELRREFGIDEADLVEGSYSDLLKHTVVESP
jgi:predicted adenylyl cyclase CyaB